MNRIVVALISVVALSFAPHFFAFAAQRAPGDIVCYSPCKVHLRGVVRFERTYGPPGFGDTPKLDSVVRTAVLYLDTPITVLASGNFEGSADQAVVQIETNMGLGKFSGRKVDVVGELHGATTATEITEIVISVSDIKMVGSARRP